MYPTSHRAFGLWLAPPIGAGTTSPRRLSRFNAAGPVLVPLQHRRPDLKDGGLRKQAGRDSFY